MGHLLTILATGISEIDNLNINKILNGLASDGISLLKKIIFTIIVFYIGKKLINFLIQVQEKYFNRVKIEISVAGFLIALTRVALYILLITTIIVQIYGIENGTVVALLGSAGLSIGLALQGGLSNFVGGVFILILKPFKVGDYIIVGANEGTVSSIDIFYTKLLTFDNKLLVMPNGALSNTNIINASNEPKRRLDINVSIHFSENVQKVKDILMTIIQSNELVLKEEDVTIFVNNMDANSVNLGIRVWVANENYWLLRWQLLEQIKKELDENNICLPAVPWDLRPKEK
jgi:small conductance mechanosensitive channel